jgi:hypothetical protein
MKHFRLLFFVFCLGLAACGGKDNGTTTTETTAQAVADNPVALPKAFYKKMKGTIGGNIAITMDLIKDDTAFSGNYYYDKVGLPLSVDGKLADGNSIELREMNEKYEETGSFSGEFTAEDVFEGTWTNPKKTKSLPFKLTETKEGVAGITFEDHRQENCRNRDKNLKNVKPEDEQWFTDTMCSYIDLRLIKVATGDAAVSHAINEAIVDEVAVGEKDYENIKAYMNSINDVAEDEYLSLEQYCGVVTNDRNVLCISVGAFEFAGGAHPNSWVGYLNFDLRTGKALKLADLLVPGGKAKLDRIGERLFLGENSEADGEPLEWDFEPGNFKLNENFAISTGGLLFTFNPYEIGPYVMGAPQVFIPYKEMDALINKNGLLGQFR